MLAGIIDTDGWVNGTNCYQIATKSEHLADDYCYLARSLGFAAYKKEATKCIPSLGFSGQYWIIGLSGQLSEIPVRIARKRIQPTVRQKNPLHTGITVETLGVGGYAGFEIDKDRLFVLGDFTVTHNTYAECSIAAYLSTGREFPDDPQNLLTGRREAMSVLLCTYEDGQGDVLRGRLEKCGADLSRIHTIRHTSPLFTINDVAALETTLDAHPEIRVMFIDPISAIMVGVDDHRDSDFRQAMQPLTNLAMNKHITIIAIKHLNKDARGDIKSRLGGTIAYLGLARSVLLFGYDNLKEPFYDPTMRYPTVYGGMVQIKQNQGSALPITYKIDDHGFHWGELDRTITPERLLPVRGSKKPE